MCNKDKRIECDCYYTKFCKIEQLDLNKEYCKNQKKEEIIKNKESWNDIIEQYSYSFDSRETFLNSSPKDFINWLKPNYNIPTKK